MISHTSPCSPGSAGSTLQRNGQGSRRSDNVRTTPMPCESCETDSAEESRDGQMSTLLRQMTLSGELASTARPSSPAGSPASRSPVPGSEEARKMIVTSGRRCLESCGSSGPLGCLERTLLESSIWNSNLVVLTWKVKGILSGRSLFQLAVSEPCTDENGCSLLLTPRETMIEEDPENFRKRMNSKRKNDRKNGFPNLAVQVKYLLPTPTTQEAESLDFDLTETGRRKVKNGDGSRGLNLARMIQMFPTPRSRESGDCTYSQGNHDKPTMTLSGAVKSWPSPTGRDWKGSGPAYQRKDGKMRGDRLDYATEAGGSNGRLNPPWVEWLMGFPIGWTDYDASEMRLSHNRSIRSLRVSHRLNKKYQMRGKHE